MEGGSAPGVGVAERAGSGPGQARASPSQGMIQEV